MSTIEHNQNFWTLACIQGATFGLPGILFGGYLAEKYGAGSALISIIIGNLILWILGLAIISMALEERKNAIQNVEQYLGKLGASFAALALILAFLNWYVLQITTSTIAIDSLFQKSKVWNKEMTIRLGVALGFLTALFAMGGMKFIKRACVLMFPLLMGFLIYSLFESDRKVNFHNTWTFSPLGVIVTVVTILPGTINLPTFFRHGRSRADCILALTLMMLFYVFFQSFPILIGISEPTDFFNLQKIESNTYVVISIIFVIVTLVLVNMVNIYFASAGWEMIFPHTWHSKEYAIVGLLGTAAYSLLQIASPMEFLENMADNFIASLGIVLLMSFLVKIIVKHRPRYFEKLINVACWVVGCIVSFFLQIYTSVDSTQVLILGMMASMLAFLAIIFVEETLWASRKLINNQT